VTSDKSLDKFRIEHPRRNPGEGGGYRKLGFIEYNGGLSVRSSLLNVVLHD
jgi:hypothetical protein